jgi:hypothetical protein
VRRREREPQVVRDLLLDAIRQQEADEPALRPREGRLRDESPWSSITRRWNHLSDRSA